jgi:hypothetical protein
METTMNYDDHIPGARGPDEPMTRVERHESYRGRTTPEVTWRVWNADYTCYTEFKTRREARKYAELEI